jgi:hypothetical protein
MRQVRARQYGIDFARQSNEHCLSRQPRAIDTRLKTYLATNSPPPPHTTLPAHVPHKAAIPAVHRDPLQPAGLLPAKEHPRTDPRWKDHDLWTDSHTATHSLLSLGRSS